MIEYIQLFYTYILPLMARLSLVYIIYVLLSKRTTFARIEYDFKYAVEQNAKLSKSAIVTHFKEMDERTHQMLDQLNNEAREQLENSMHHVHKLSEDLEKIVANQKVLNSRLSELERSNAELHNEIKKRDAIIERKTKQILRFKGDK